MTRAAFRGFVLVAVGGFVACSHGSSSSNRGGDSTGPVARTAESTVNGHGAETKVDDAATSASRSGVITARPPHADATPATRRGMRTLEALTAVERSLRETRYDHATFVDERRGIYRWDCSAMTAWFLSRTAPRALAHVGRGRPLARSFADAIERAPVDRGRGGWQRVLRVADALPGDVFAWRKPPGFPSTNSGHVGIVIGAPVRAAEPDVWLVRIADATSLPHDDDDRAPPGGLGRGTIAFRVDAEGNGIAYGWFGAKTPTSYYLATPIFIGRLMDDPA